MRRSLKSVQRLAHFQNCLVMYGNSISVFSFHPSVCCKKCTLHFAAKRDCQNANFIYINPLFFPFERSLGPKMHQFASFIAGKWDVDRAVSCCESKKCNLSHVRCDSSTALAHAHKNGSTFLQYQFLQSHTLSTIAVICLFVAYWAGDSHFYYQIRLNAWNSW